MRIHYLRLIIVNYWPTGPLKRHLLCQVETTLRQKPLRASPLAPLFLGGVRVGFLLQTYLSERIMSPPLSPISDTTQIRDQMLLQ